MPKKKIIISILILLSLFVIDFIKTNIYFRVKAITKNIKIIDKNIDHNQAVDVIEYAQSKGIKTPDILVNFDAHSDIYVYKKIDEKEGGSIADWVNEYLMNNPNVEEVYWVLPRYNAKQMQYRLKIADCARILIGQSCPLNETEVPDVDKKPYVQELLLDTKTGYMRDLEINYKKLAKEESKRYLRGIPEQERINNPNLPSEYTYKELIKMGVLFEPKNPKYRKVKVITCTPKSLPDLKNKNVFLSIDLDYITLSGYDSFLQRDKNRFQIRYDSARLLSDIKKKNINPEIISITLSPAYTPENDEKQLLNIAKRIIKYSKKNDEIKYYKRALKKPKAKNSEKLYIDYLE